jgi:dTDP-4-amino-4,6-dideoxygalactose transaminase
MTFISTYFAITELGGIPLPIDIGNDGVIDIKQLPKKLSTNVKGLIAVNLYGNLCNFKYIKNYCKKNNLFLLEDSAQSHGAYFKKNPNKKIWGDVSAFSFYPSKNLGSLSDGGAIITNKFSIFKKIKLLRNYGSLRKYKHEFLGYNSRLNMLNAAFLSKKLNYLNLINTKRERQEKFYKNNLKKISELSFLERNSRVKSSHHIFMIFTKKRDNLKNFLLKKNIETLIHYPIIPLAQKPYLLYKNKIKSLLISCKFSKQGLSLPLGEHISNNKIKYIIKNIKLFFKLSSK